MTGEWDVAEKRCENGHFIDESWDICPYCPPDSGPAGDLQVVKPRRGDDEPPAPRREPDRYARRGSGGSEPPERPVAAPPHTVAASRLELESAQTLRYVVGWMIGLNGTIRGESFPVRMGRNVLGRSRSSDVMIHDEQASAHHADLVYRPEEKRYILMDHNSTNGTYVNGVEIEPRRDLVSRDIVTIGSHKLLFIALSDFGLSWDEDGELR